MPRYNVESWLYTEKVVEVMEAEFKGFSLTPHEKVHLVDLMGRLLPPDLVQAVMDFRRTGAGFARARALISDHMGINFRNQLPERTLWTLEVLLGTTI